MKGRDGRVGRFGRVHAAASLAASALGASYKRHFVPRQRHLRAQLARLPRGNISHSYIHLIFLYRLNRPKSHRTLRDDVA